MSYILDALNKSESERKAEQTPSLYVQHGPIPGASRRRKKKGVFILAAIFLLLAINTLILFFLLPAKQISTKNDVADAPSERVQQAEEAPAKTGLNDPQPVVTTQESDIAPAHASDELENSNQASEPAQDDQAQPDKSVDMVSAENRLMIFEDLPENILLSLPDIHIAGHTYSEDPRRRMILINNRILREGDFVEQGLQLKEITWNGVIFDFKGTLFTINEQ